MKRQILLLLSALILITISHKAKAQDCQRPREAGQVGVVVTQEILVKIYGQKVARLPPLETLLLILEHPIT